MVWTSKIKLLSKFSLFIILTAKIKFHKVFKPMTYEIVNFSYGYLFFTQKHPYFCYIQGLFIHSLLLMYTVVPLFLILYFLFSVHLHFFLNIWRIAETFMLLKFWHKNRDSQTQARQLPTSVNSPSFCYWEILPQSLIHHYFTVISGDV